MKFRILTKFVWFGNVSNCLSFKYHFEDITKFIIMVKNGNNEAKKKICGFPVSSYKNLGRVGRF